MSPIPIGPEYLAQPLNLSVLSGKNALIIDRASGLGAAITKKFAENGAHYNCGYPGRKKGRFMRASFLDGV
jgi:hypothetical protein